MEHYICIHGHFYQPPRENPWLESVEQQDAAYPYHDWNARITEECYASNASSRILNEKKQIIKILNNYSKISFDFGPTLLSWLYEKFPDVYYAIIQADKNSQNRLEGHGNAIAHAYNHAILPLCNQRDKYTQIIWGIRDFTHRFQRQPQGLWLPETAVDLESLAIMANEGIKFTILAQRQARRFRKIGTNIWQDVYNERIDPTVPYLLHLPQGETIVIFFYDGAVSQEVAFSSILNRGENFVNRLISIFHDNREGPQLAHIATDGETYGHHHPHGNMALAYALDYIERKNISKIANYSYFLEKCPPTAEVEILENSSWSCIHGVERWRSSCGCNTGEHRGWNQDWRTHLRETFDWLRDRLILIYEERSKNFFKDPWEARNLYIDVIMDRSAKNLQKFFEKTSHHPLNSTEQKSALCLLEMQRHTMLMYTSCGWFFDDLSGIETIQVISYAARAIQLSEKFFGQSLENKFIEKLSNAKSNVKNFENGKNIYEKIVKPGMLDWKRIGAHYAISCLFKNYEKKIKIYCYEVEREDFQTATTGNFQFIMGHAEFKSMITTESAKLAFAAIHFGDQNINCGVCEFNKILDYPKSFQELSAAFERGDVVAVNNSITHYFGESTYSISSLFSDEQRHVLDKILEGTVQEVETAYTQLYKRHVALMKFIENLKIPLPESFRATAEHFINSEINSALGKEKLKVTHILKLLKEAELAKIKLNTVTLGFTLKNNLEKMMQRIKAEPLSLLHLEQLSHAMVIANSLPFGINLFQVQNTFYELLENVYPKLKQSATAGDLSAKAWIEQFSTLGNQLAVYVP